MRKCLGLMAVLCALSAPAGAALGANGVSSGEELRMRPCSNQTVRNSKEVIGIAQGFLQSLGKLSHGPFVELRVEDPINKRKYSLVLIGKLDAPVSDVVMVSGQKNEERAHAAFSPPIRYVGPASAIHAAGIPSDDVRNCRLLRVQQRPYNSDFLPIWEITTSTKTFFVDHEGYLIESDYNTLLKKDIGG